MTSTLFWATQALTVNLGGTLSSLLRVALRQVINYMTLTVPKLLILSKIPITEFENDRKASYIHKYDIFGGFSNTVRIALATCYKMRLFKVPTFFQLLVNHLFQKRLKAVKDR